MISEQDVNFESNAILSELDKGLRSCRLGDESKAIVCFPDLFAKHPFPILINSACLKLAELFRNGSNFSKLLILRVLQQAEKHLEKILNLDEFVRRITSVCYSNDPVARAITLRVLGSIACVASQRKNIHHAIRNSLDSTDEIEVQAAIEAAALFAKQSSVFALSIYPKILSILNNSSADLSVETKIKLLSVLHHEHYNSEVSRDVRQRCLNYLASNESDYFVASVLHTLTYISITSLTDIPDQIAVLLNSFSGGTSASGPNLKLKYEIVKELQLLTKTSPHFWSEQNVADFVGLLKNDQIIRNSPGGLICGFLVILRQLIRCPCLLAGQRPEVLRAFYEEARQFCLAIMQPNDQRAVVRSELNKTANCLRVMTELSGKSPEVNRQTIDYLAGFLHSTSIKLEDHHFEDCTRSCKLILSCVVKIANQSEEASQRLIELLCSILAESKTSNRLISLVCETICAIENKKNSTNLVNCIRQSIVGNRQLNDRSFISLCTVYFQLTTEQTSADINLRQLNIENRCAWFYYKLLRQTMRYGHHEISLELCDKLQYHASNENIYFWFMGLMKISEAECSLLRVNAANREDNILASIELLSESLSFLKAAILENYPQAFACEFIKLRSKFLHNNLMLIKYCKMIRSSPAASISNLIALNQRDDILKCGSIVNQMRENCREFRRLADDYAQLYQNSFNADQSTLTCLQLLQNCCTIMAEAIESVFHANRPMAPAATGVSGSVAAGAVGLPEHRLLKNTCDEVRAFIRSAFGVKPEAAAGPAQSTEHLLEISGRLLRIPIVVPRYFFQPLQNTALKLAVSPQPKANSLEQSIVIYSNTNFAFRVEGLIKSGNTERHRPIREVNQILIQVTSVSKSNQSSLSSIFESATIGPAQQKLQSIATPHNDYFQEQFLLNLKTGYHQINVEAFVIDQSHAQWNLGANSSLNVKVLEAT